MSDDTHNLYEAITRQATALQPWLWDIRNTLHRRPELAWEEFATTELICASLRSLGLEPRVIRDGVGVVADIIPEGMTGVPPIALRADIDGLPMNDLSPKANRSRVRGKAHACGHDVHTTSLIGAARVLVELMKAGLLRRPVRLLFQPSEERQQPSGASVVVDLGFLDDVTDVYALHCTAHLPIGRFGVREGGVTSACGMLELTANGPGGHTARPFQTANLGREVARVLFQLPDDLLRSYDPRATLSLEFGTATFGNGAANVIPSEAIMRGTVRTPEVERWRNAEADIRTALDRITRGRGVEWEINYTPGVPPTFNTKTGHSASVIERLWDADAVRPTEQSLGGEDFGNMLEAVRKNGGGGNLVRMGVRPLNVPAEEAADIHQSRFDPDPGSVAYGAAYLAGVAAIPTT
ncbi:amidohydrolase [Yinghuangia sp. ASG 101]|uniref:amidohydrolase n=1 Tax=Yinghuangia sp. ASG 101 TaxID=2896848 RepID=UPI001E538C21|nr:amidohydrolase [Yinghuangia sp. ASG 101]UGQ09699.1 amidohydrolase [Yinghuangia sp. ASG 101]